MPLSSFINVNMTNNEAINRDGSLLEYCYLHDITIQPWSILQASWPAGRSPLILRCLLYSYL